MPLHHYDHRHLLPDHLDLYCRLETPTTLDPIIVKHSVLIPINNILSTLDPDP